MNFIKFTLITILLIGSNYCNSLYSQTFISAKIGASMHNLEIEEHTGSIVQSYEGLINNFDCDIGLDTKHYLKSKWFISLNSNFYMKNHSYSIHSLGINPRSDYSYRLFDYGLKTGVEIINNLEVGIGASKILLYDQKVINSFITEQSTGSLYCSTFFMSYIWNKFIVSITYYRSIINSNLTDIDLFSIYFGYRWKVLEPINRKNKVICPKL